MPKNNGSRTFFAADKQAENVEDRKFIEEKMFFIPAYGPPNACLVYQYCLVNEMSRTKSFHNLPKKFETFRRHLGVKTVSIPKVVLPVFSSLLRLQTLWMS